MEECNCGNCRQCVQEADYQRNQYNNGEMNDVGSRAWEEEQDRQDHANAWWSNQND